MSLEAVIIFAVVLLQEELTGFASGIKLSENFILCDLGTMHFN